jgi:4-carboxymuconolactone decarboxylase
MAELIDRGRASHRRVPGAWHVMPGKTGAAPFEAPFQAQIPDAARGHVRARGTLPPREGSMVTMALLDGLGTHDKPGLHMRRSAGSGTTEAGIMEVPPDVAAHPCVPRANSAMRAGAADA